MLIPLFEWPRGLGMLGAAVMEYVTSRATMSFVFALLADMKVFITLHSSVAKVYQ